VPPSDPPESRWSSAVVKRFARLLAIVAAVTALVSLAIGLPSGNSALRSLSTGFYLAGCGTLVIGFALALRGPVRPGAGDRRGLRWIPLEERSDAIADAALVVALAIVLLALGVLADTRYPLV
jgi:hypothetical protein